MLPWMSGDVSHQGSSRSLQSTRAPRSGARDRSMEGGYYQDFTDEPSFDVSEGSENRHRRREVGRAGSGRGAVQKQEEECCRVGRPPLCSNPCSTMQHDGWLAGWLAGGWVVGGEAQGAYVAAAVVGRGGQTSATCHLSPPATALHYAAATSQAASSSWSSLCRRAASCCLLPSPHVVDLSQRIDSSHSPPSSFPSSLPSDERTGAYTHSRPSSVVRRMFECLFECSECMHVDIGHGAAHSADGLAALRQVVHVARGVPQDAAARDLLHGGHQLARRQVRRQQRARAVPGESVRRSVCSSASLRYHTKKSWVHYYPCVSFPFPSRRAFRSGISPATLTSRGSSRRAAAMTSSSRWRGAE